MLQYTGQEVQVKGQTGDPIGQSEGLEGGQPIGFNLAVALRKLVYGSTVHALSKSFKQTAFQFQSSDGPFPFGLFGERNGARAVIMCVQAEILKHLIFQYADRDTIRKKKVLKPTDQERRAKLISSLADILWRAGQSHEAFVCLCQKDDCFLVTDRKYRKDGVTEKLRLFKFDSHDSLMNFIGQHLNYFENSAYCGVLLFIYSVILSRTLQGILEDCCDGRMQLLTDNEQCGQALVNLLLTGRCSPFVHNGDIEYDENAKLLDIPLRGINERADIGFLFYHNEENDNFRTQVGSMLKTPKYPIWVTLVNGHPGVLFSLDPDLVNDWKSENQFTLRYYTCLVSQTKEAILHIDTRLGRQLQSQTKEGRRLEEKRIPVLEKCIMTKWPGASVEWDGGMIPFVA